MAEQPIPDKLGEQERRQMEQERDRLKAQGLSSKEATKQAGQQAVERQSRR